MAGSPRCRVVATGLVSMHEAHGVVDANISRLQQLQRDPNLMAYSYRSASERRAAHVAVEGASVALLQSSRRLGATIDPVFSAMQGAGIDVQAQPLRDARAAIQLLADNGRDIAAQATRFHATRRATSMSGAEWSGAQGSTAKLAAQAAIMPDTIRRLAVVIDDAARVAPDVPPPSRIAEVAGRWSRVGELLDMAATRGLVDAGVVRDARSSMTIHDDTLRTTWLEHPSSLRGSDDVAPRVHLPDPDGVRANVAHDDLLMRAELAVRVASSRAAEYDGGSAAKRVLAQLDSSFAPPEDLLGQLLAAIDTSRESRLLAQSGPQVLAEFAKLTDALTPPGTELLDDVERAIRLGDEHDRALATLIERTSVLRSGAVERPGIGAAPS